MYVLPVHLAYSVMLAVPMVNVAAPDTPGTAQRSSGSTPIAAVTVQPSAQEAAAAGTHAHTRPPSKRSLSSQVCAIPTLSPLTAPTIARSPAVSP